MSEKQIEPVQKDLAPEVSFKPTPHMEKWIDQAMQMETDEIKAIAEACGMDRNNWYNWLKLDGFLDWFNAEWDRRLQSVGWRLDTIAVRNAKRDYRYWEGMQKRLGRLQDKPLIAIGAKADEMTIQIE